MNEYQRCAGINITSSRLQFVEIEKKSDDLLIDNLGQTFISPPIKFNEQNETSIQEQLQVAFYELNVRNPIKSKTISFTLPPELFIIIQLPYEPNLNQSEIREEFNWEISQLFPFISVDDLAIKFYELEGNLLPGKKNALVVALNKKYLLQIKSFCLKNNLTPKLVDNASITANSFVNYYYNGNKSATINLFNSRSSVTFFFNIAAKPAYVKVFQKQEKNYINKIIEEISKEKFKDAVDHQFKSAILSGENLEGDLLSEIGRGTGLVFEHLNPFEIIKMKSDFANNEISPDQFSSFISATGIASRFS